MSRRLCACVLTAGTFVRQPWKKLWSLVLYVLVKRQLTFYIILLLLDVCKKDVTAAELWQLCSQFYLRFGWHTLIGVYFSVFLVLSSNKAYPMNGFRYVVCLKAFEWRLKFCVTCIILFVCMFLFWSCLQTQQCNRVSDLAYCTCKKKKWVATHSILDCLENVHQTVVPNRWCRATVFVPRGREKTFLWWVNSLAHEERVSALSRCV